MSKDIKIITIIGDSLSLPSSDEKITLKDTYPFKLQSMLYPDNYHVVVRSSGRNSVSTVSLRENLDRNVLYNDSEYVIFHLGIVDCAPRLFSLMQDRILYVFSITPGLKTIANLIFKFQTKYRWFFTKSFPKTYVSKKEFKEKYSLILKEIREQARPKKFFLINIAETSEENKKKSYNFEKNIADYNAILSELAEENSDICELVDFFPETKRNRNFILAGEGIHLTRAGHNRLAEILYKKIKNKID
jgi:lysophospholipase L1-like esterase